MSKKGINFIGSQNNTLEIIQYVSKLSRECQIPLINLTPENIIEIPKYNSLNFIEKPLIYSKISYPVLLKDINITWIEELKK